MPKTAAFLEQNSVAHDALWVHFAETLERGEANAESRVTIAQKERDDAFSFVHAKADNQMFRWSELESELRKAREENAQLRALLGPAFRDSERLAWLHRGGPNDAAGCEWGIFRVLWDGNG